MCLGFDVPIDLLESDSGTQSGVEVGTVEGDNFLPPTPPCANHAAS